jgi:hypothetical protein
MAAAYGSEYTRSKLCNVCRGWKWVCESLPELWSHIRVVGGSSTFIQELYTNQAINSQSTPLHIHLSNPIPSSLEYLVRRISTDRWESLEITLTSSTALTESRCFDIFDGSTFFGLKSLKIVEDKEIDSSRRDYFADTQIIKIDDPYSALYDAIFLTAISLQSVFVDADLSAVANAYRLFGQRVSSVGGASAFIQQALPPPAEYEESPYSHVCRLSIYHWDHELVSGVSLPNLTFLEVTHCALPHPRTATNPPLTVFLPSLRVLRLTRHSIKVLSQLCAGRLLSLTVNEFEGYGPQDDCLPFTMHPEMPTFELDRWTSTSIERAFFNIPISSESLSKFLQDAHGLVSLTLRVPQDKIWQTNFVRAMTTTEMVPSEYGDLCDTKLTHCTGLAHLCILMNWKYREPDWLWEMRAIHDRRQDFGFKSMICRWNGDSRNVESGPSDCYIVGPLETAVELTTEQEEDQPANEPEIRKDDDEELLEEWQKFEIADGPYYFASQVERRSPSPETV